MPELVANGPDIPTRLMNELDSGRVVFFCGAGVSAGPESGLPGFAALVKHVYAENRMVPDDVEREALDCDERNPDHRRPNFDKALGLLEKRLGAQPLRKTVIQRLSAPPTGPLDLHKALIALSQGERGVRLVTTNFDNRFAEAGLDGSIDVAPKLPFPKPHDWSSLVHLHGRILANDDGSNLVLTAADFGRAYLTERWAARFVTELFREFTVVFAGYSVGDPVMSYMLDALDAERDKGARFAKAYAFAAHDGTSTGRSKARDGWLAKNVEPILYDKIDKHRLLSDTLIEWAGIRSDPHHARSRIALNEISKLPAGSNDPVAERVTWALQDPVAAQALADHPPFVDEDDFPKIERWLEIFAEKGLLHCAAASENPDGGNSQTLDTTRLHLARWMARHLHVPQLLGWAARNGGYLHPGLRRAVRDRLADPGSNIPNIPYRLRLLWTVMSNHEPVDRWRLVRIADRHSAAASDAERRHIEDDAIESLAPRLVVRYGPAPRPSFRQYFNGKAGPLGPMDTCGHLKLVTGEEDTWHWIEKIVKDTSVLSRHAETLTGYLERALDLLANDDDARPNSSLDWPSIAEHEQNRDLDGWIRLGGLTRDSYFALADAAPARGDNLLRRWALSDWPLFKRLALHALTENKRADIRLARRLLLSDRKPGVWERELRREVLRFFRLAGSRLPRSLRVEIVQAIHSGPKTKRARAAYSEADAIHREKARRLHKLSISGARLDKKSRALAEEAQSGVAGGLDERDEFAVWSEESRYIGDDEFAPKHLLVGSIDDVATALENAGISEYEFRSLVLRRPVKIASALRRLGGRDAWPTTYWRYFLWELSMLREGPRRNARLPRYVALLLSRAPDELFAKVDSALSGFVKNLAEDYGIDREQELEPLWTKAWSGADMGEGEADYLLDDPLSGALNHAAGKLADAALIRLEKYERKPGEGLPQPIRSYFDTIIGNPNGKLGRVMLASRLYYLFVVDRNWVEKRLIPLLDLGSSEEARDLWSAYGSWPTASPNLLLAFKESFLEILRDDDPSVQRKRNLASLFMKICFDAPNELTPQEIQGVVGSASEEILRAMLGSLKHRLAGDTGERGKLWRERLHVWLRKYWPRESDCNTPGTSKTILDMLVECGDAFEEAVTWALPYLRPLDGPGLYRLRENGHAERYPDSMLQVLDKVVNAEAFPVHQRSMLREILDKMAAAKRDLKSNSRFQKLYRVATQ